MKSYLNIGALRPTTFGFLKLRFLSRFFLVLVVEHAQRQRLLLVRLILQLGRQKHSGILEIPLRNEQHGGHARFAGEIFQLVVGGLGEQKTGG